MIETAEELFFLGVRNGNRDLFIRHVDGIFIRRYDVLEVHDDRVGTAAETILRKHLLGGLDCAPDLNFTLIGMIY